MRYFTSLLAVVSLGSSPVLADVWQFSAPAVIQNNVPFNLSFDFELQAPYQNRMFLGYAPRDDDTLFYLLPQHAKIGNQLAELRLGDYPLNYMDRANVTDIKIHDPNYKVGSKLAIHIMLWNEIGAQYTVGVSSYLLNVTIGNETTYDNLVSTTRFATDGSYQIFSLSPQLP